MKNILLVVDMQNDFIDGVLGSEAARAIVPKACQVIDKWSGHVYVTRDIHSKFRYDETIEGARIPFHCEHGTDGYEVNEKVKDSIYNKPCIYSFDKETFGANDLPDYIRMNEDFKHIDSITIIGLCTDICVISNALILRAAFPTTKIKVISSATAGTSEENKQAALAVMKSCLIDVGDVDENNNFIMAQA